MSKEKIEPKVFSNRCDSLNSEIDSLQKELVELDSLQPGYHETLFKIRSTVDGLKVELENLIAQSRNISKKDHQTRVYLWGTINNYSDVLSKFEQARDYPHTFARPVDEVPKEASEGKKERKSNKPS
ncbi:MAG: hypothetical protein SGJ10_01805 [Bacteroidota bacterium]|nr:hypothetical protein [Bacteroidota bacterium]